MNEPNIGDALTPDQAAILTEGICPICFKEVEFVGDQTWSCGQHWWSLVPDEPGDRPHSGTP
ncbi:hypothetical protein [Leptolyngbya sp. FACHB-16]|uniref:hypothetical protein n=1 Tax=unclassified Leptolyngbya TaxID=2650499 RepID=UPI0016870FBD|nr:hypothetical protein [Leptolyngbya sp. FACHB-16]MBD2156225.1 hypothetical protein [Leptolyngbya sp. FACHB-16]